MNRKGFTTPTFVVCSLQSEDEALALAIQASLQDQTKTQSTSSPQTTQEEEDRALAQALAESEREEQNRRRQQQVPKTLRIINNYSSRSLGPAKWAIDSEAMRARGIIVLVKSNWLVKNIETKQL